MLTQWLSHALLWVLGLAVAGVHAQQENDFENSPTTSRVPMRAFSLAPPYLDSDMGNRWFDFGGDTIVRADRYVRLTSDRPSQRGWLFSRVPITATNFQIEVEFRIHGERNLFGDGFAMWLTKERATSGPVFGSTDQFEGLGIFFDTYKNGRPAVTFPLVMAMMGDGQAMYDQERDGKANEIASCSARGLRGASVPTKARLTYFQDKVLALDLQYKSDRSWTKCFSIKPSADLDIKIPHISYLGFSAETGELHDNHDIISVNAYSLYNKQGNSQTSNGAGPDAHATKQRTKKPPKPTKESWTWGGFFFKTFLFLGLIIGAYVGWTIYRTSRRGRF
ncbi:hypothetical protein VTO42DRAFT_8031 [Malbranchea cinnamomea]